MKWGVHKAEEEKPSTAKKAQKADNSTGSSIYGSGKNKNFKQIKKDAAADAKKYAQAKAFYGEGAGTRRKILKNELSKKMKDPDYKAEFDRQLEQIDMEKVQKDAVTERKVKDVGKFTAKTARGAANFIIGTGAPMSLAGIVVGMAAKRALNM